MAGLIYTQDSDLKNQTPVGASNPLPVSPSTSAGAPAVVAGGSSGGAGAPMIPVGGTDGSNVRVFNVDSGGRLFVTPHAGSAATAGGIPNVARLVAAAATTNATLVKGGAGKLFKLRGYNAAAAVRYLKIYNKASAPTVGTDTPYLTIALKPSDQFVHDWGDVGLQFTTGLAFALTTGSADSDTAALTANDVVGLNLEYL